MSEGNPIDSRNSYAADKPVRRMANDCTETLKASLPDVLESLGLSFRPPPQNHQEDVDNYDQQASQPAANDSFGELLPTELDKPRYSYSTLVGMALCSAPGRQLTLANIYHWIVKHHPDYTRESSENWRSSVRDVLKNNDAFQMKVLPGITYKSVWTVDPAHAKKFESQNRKREGSNLATKKDSDRLGAEGNRIMGGKRQRFANRTDHINIQRAGPPNDRIETIRVTQRALASGNSDIDQESSSYSEKKMTILSCLNLQTSLPRSISPNVSALRSFSQSEIRDHSQNTEQACLVNHHTARFSRTSPRTSGPTVNDTQHAPTIGLEVIKTQLLELSQATPMAEDLDTTSTHVQQRKIKSHCSTFGAVDLANTQFPRLETIQLATDEYNQVKQSF